MGFLTVDLKHCARCGGDHEQLVFRALTQPTHDGWTHWTPCPANGEPILLKETADEKAYIEPPKRGYSFREKLAEYEYEVCFETHAELMAFVETHLPKAPPC